MGDERTFLERLLFPRPHLMRGAVASAIAQKTVVVTGASFGIGEQLALTLGAAGAHVVLIARSGDRLQLLADAIHDAGGRASVLVGDLRDPIALQRTINSLLALPDGVDVLVSNAGKSIFRPLEDSLARPDDIDRTIALNFVAPAKLVLALAPVLAARRGQVVNVSAANVLLLPASGWAAYQASKTAFDQWLRSCEPELAAAGIDVSTLYFALVRTRMITPIRAYDRLPAMPPDQAGQHVMRAIVTRRRRWAPWWIGPLALGSVILRRPCEALMRRLARVSERNRR